MWNAGAGDQREQTTTARRERNLINTYLFRCCFSYHFYKSFYRIPFQFPSSSTQPNIQFISINSGINHIRHGRQQQKKKNGSTVNGKVTTVLLDIAFFRFIRSVDRAFPKNYIFSEINRFASFQFLGAFCQCQTKVWKLCSTFSD